MKTTDLKSAIYDVLAEYSSARDNDVYLFTWIYNNHWHIDLRGLSALDLLKKIHEGTCPKFDSVTRLRRELQNEHPELRGETWKTRHAEAEDVRLQKQSLHRAAIAETAKGGAQS
jgi:hypothetical protein